MVSHILAWLTWLTWLQEQKLGLWTFACPVREGPALSEKLEGLRLTGLMRLPAKTTSQSLAGMLSIQCNNIHINNQVKNHQSQDLENSRGFPLLGNPGIFPWLKVKHCVQIL